MRKKYEVLSDEYDDCEARAEKVRDRIDAVEDVASALFKEWAEEINQYTSTKLKADSKKKLSATKARYAKLIKAMKKASSKMDPVLAAFKDQVLYLKHNLNAKAIGRPGRRIDHHPHQRGSPRQRHGSLHRRSRRLHQDAGVRWAFGAGDASGGCSPQGRPRRAGVSDGQGAALDPPKAEGLWNPIAASRGRSAGVRAMQGRSDKRPCRAG